MFNKTMSGGYLDAGSNPYLQDIVNRSVGAAQSGEAVGRHAPRNRLQGIRPTDDRREDDHDSRARISAWYRRLARPTYGSHTDPKSNHERWGACLTPS